MSRPNLLIVSSTQLLILQEDKVGFYSPLESISWPTDPRQIQIEPLLLHLQDQLTVIFSPESVYLIQVSLPKHSEDEKLELKKLIRLKIPENIEELTWGYRVASKNDQATEYEVFAPLPRWWSPVQNQLAVHKIKFAHLLPQLNPRLSLDESIIATLDQPEFHLIFPSQPPKSQISPNLNNSPDQLSSDQISTQSTNIDQPTSRRRSVLTFLLVIIFLVALLAIVLIGWSVFNK